MSSFLLLANEQASDSTIPMSTILSITQSDYGEKIQRVQETRKWLKECDTHLNNLSQDLENYLTRSAPQQPTADQIETFLALLGRNDFVDYALTDYYGDMFKLALFFGVLKRRIEHGLSMTRPISETRLYTDLLEIMNSIVEKVKQDTSFHQGLWEARERAYHLVTCSNYPL